MLLELTRGTMVVDLLDFDGIMLADQGWRPASSDDWGEVIETMTVTVYDYPTKMRDIDLMAEAAQDYLISSEHNAPVYLRAQLAGMSAPRRAVVTGISYKWAVPQDDQAAVNHPALVLAIKRTPWEDETPIERDFDGIGQNKMVGVTTFKLDGPARIELVKTGLAVNTDAGTTTNDYYIVATTSDVLDEDDLWRVCDNTSYSTLVTTACSVRDDGKSVEVDSVPAQYAAAVAETPASDLFNLPPGYYIVLLRATLGNSSNDYQPSLEIGVRNPEIDHDPSKRYPTVGRVSLQAGVCTHVVGVVKIPQFPPVIANELDDNVYRQHRKVNLYVYIDSLQSGDTVYIHGIALVPAAHFAETADARELGTNEYAQGSQQFNGHRGLYIAATPTGRHYATIDRTPVPVTSGDYFWPSTGQAFVIAGNLSGAGVRGLVRLYPRYRGLV